MCVCFIHRSSIINNKWSEFFFWSIYWIFVFFLHLLCSDDMIDIAFLIWNIQYWNIFIFFPFVLFFFPLIIIKNKSKYTCVYVILALLKDSIHLELTYLCIICMYASYEWKKIWPCLIIKVSFSFFFVVFDDMNSFQMHTKIMQMHTHTHMFSKLFFVVVVVEKFPIFFPLTKSLIYQKWPYQNGIISWKRIKYRHTIENHLICVWNSLHILGRSIFFWFFVEKFFTVKNKSLHFMFWNSVNDSIRKCRRFIYESHTQFYWRFFHRNRNEERERERERWFKWILFYCFHSLTHTLTVFV